MVAIPPRGVENEAEQGGVAGADALGVETEWVCRPQAGLVLIEGTPAPRLRSSWSHNCDGCMVEVSAGDLAGADRLTESRRGSLVADMNGPSVEDGTKGHPGRVRRLGESVSDRVVAGDVVWVTGQPVGTDGEENVRTQ